MSFVLFTFVIFLVLATAAVVRLTDPMSIEEEEKEDIERESAYAGGQ